MSKSDSVPIAVIDFAERWGLYTFGNDTNHSQAYAQWHGSLSTQTFEAWLDNQFWYLAYGARKFPEPNVERFYWWSIVPCDYRRPSFYRAIADTCGQTYLEVATDLLADLDLHDELHLTDDDTRPDRLVDILAAAIADAPIMTDDYRLGLATAKRKSEGR